MRLSQLLQPADLLDQPTDNDVDVAGLALDSRHVGPGFLFAALPGQHASGAQFVAEAVQRGAAVVLCGLDDKIPESSAQVLRVAQPRLTLARMAARFYGPQPKHVVAVTGTSGKSSVVEYVRQIWNHCGLNGASIGTLGAITAHQHDDTNLTTPDCITLHQQLQKLAAAGVQRVAIEASSHGLEMQRLHAVNIFTGAFTNLSRDHLDFHPTMEAYLAAKLRLFREIVPSGAPVVLNADIPEYQTLRSVCLSRGQRILSFGRQGHDICLKNMVADAKGLTLEWRVMGMNTQTRLNLVGDFQAWNVMTALALVMAEPRMPLPQILAFLPQLQAVPGRLQHVGEKSHAGGVAQVFVDYAHKPEALATVLKTLRPLVTGNGKLWVVFGCGGNRDKGKRPLMGRIATQLADKVVITDDNPRTEEPAAIRAEILAGCDDAHKVSEADNRRAAIEESIGQLGAGDILVIAGKGHETGQIVGDTELPFDDAAVAAECLAHTLRGAA